MCPAQGHNTVTLPAVNQKDFFQTNAYLIIEEVYGMFVQLQRQCL